MAQRQFKKRMIRAPYPVILANGTQIQKGDQAIEMGPAYKLALQAKGVQDVTEDLVEKAEKARNAAVALLEDLTGESAMPRDDRALAAAVARAGAADERIRVLQLGIEQMDADKRAAIEGEARATRELDLLRGGLEQERKGLEQRIGQLSAAFDGSERDRAVAVLEIERLKAELAAADEANKSLAAEIERLMGPGARLTIEPVVASIEGEGI